MACLNPGRAAEAEMDRVEALGRRRPLTDREADRLAELTFRAQHRGYRLAYRAPQKRAA